MSNPIIVGKAWVRGKDGVMRDVTDRVQTSMSMPIRADKPLPAPKAVSLCRCPFCNGHNLTVDIEEQGYGVRCRECGAMGPSAESLGQACRRWNGSSDDGWTSMVVEGHVGNRNDRKPIEV